MHRRPVFMSALALLLALSGGVRAAAQAPAPPAQPPATPPQQGAHGEPVPPPRPAGGFQEPPRFPAHQRAAAPQEVLDRGKAQYAGICSACHGADARGGQLGGPNLLRSQLVLDDKDGELITPVVQNGRPGPPPMPPLPMAPDDIKAVAAWLHSLQAQGTNQGGPPPGPETELNILIGDAKSGEAFFAKTCASCHSTTGDLQGLAARVASPMALQNMWVSGGVARPRGARRAGPPPASKPVMATVTLATGEKVSGRLARLDDFLVTLVLDDATTRTIPRKGAIPKIQVQDPLAKHRELLGVLTNANMHDVTAFLSTLK
jgi:cytochrome c oxidase cbb3-type subunit III